MNDSRMESAGVEGNGDEPVTLDPGLEFEFSVWCCSSSGVLGNDGKRARGGGRAGGK